MSPVPTVDTFMRGHSKGFIAVEVDIITWYIWYIFIPRTNEPVDKEGGFCID